MCNVRETEVFFLQPDVPNMGLIELTFRFFNSYVVFKDAGQVMHLAGHNKTAEPSISSAHASITLPNAANLFCCRQSSG